MRLSSIYELLNFNKKQQTDSSTPNKTQPVQYNSAVHWKGKKVIVPGGW